MVDSVSDHVVLEKCVKDILTLIKPVEDDRNKRLSAILELENCINPIAALRGVAVKPFGSFVSELYSKSGDLDLSVQLCNGSNLPINKKKKQNVLREVRRALLTSGVTRSMQFIPHARVPVLQYVSNRFGISCDISIDNYAGLIKSKIFYWVNTLDDRFGDMVLLIKEWAKAQNINDPKSGSFNSYSLCLLVLFHFQTLEPPILPPLKEIYEGNIAEDTTESSFYNEKYLDEVCTTNVARIKLKNKGQRNESSLCRLLATFFRKFIHINALPDNVISTYTGQFARKQDNSSQTTEPYRLFVEDPIERPDNAARAVSTKGLGRIASAFNDASRKFDSLELLDRDELLALLCTPAIVPKLGGNVIANSGTKCPRRSRQQTRSARRVEHDQPHRVQEGRGFTVSRPAHKKQQATIMEHQTAGQYQNHNHRPATTMRPTAAPYHYHNFPQAYTLGHQTAPYQHHYHPQMWVPKAGPYQNGFQTAGPYQSQDQAYNTARFQTAGTYLSQNQQSHGARFQAAAPYDNQQRRKEYATNHQTNMHAAAPRNEAFREPLYNGSRRDSRSQASNGAASQRYPPTQVVDQYR